MKFVMFQVVLVVTLTVPLVDCQRSGHPQRRRTSLVQGETLVDEINQQGEWRAHYGQRFRGRNVNQLKSMLGVADDHDEVLEQHEQNSKSAVSKKPLPIVANDAYGYNWYNRNYGRNRNSYWNSNRNIITANAEIQMPVSFDSRQQWPECSNQINKIMDQSLCGSCWAVSSAAVFSDRLCIVTNGTVQKSLSADDLLSCCTNCGNSCNGGYPFLAFDYIDQHGIVTGGAFGDNNTCLPYPFPPCTGAQASQYAQCSSGNFVPPTCTHHCQPGYDLTWNKDKHFGNTPVSIKNNVQATQKEIFQNGPVVIGAMEVYEDFYYYQGGIYRHLTGGFVGLHAVRLIGWGVENNTAYWLVANSWGRQWGENGFFRIRRGVNECNVEATINAAHADQK